MGHTDLVMLLLERGAKISEKDKRDWPALPEAASQGNLGAVELLLAEGREYRSQR